MAPLAFTRCYNADFPCHFTCSSSTRHSAQNCACTSRAHEPQFQYNHIANHFTHNLYKWWSTQSAVFPLLRCELGLLLLVVVVVAAILCFRCRHRLLPPLKFKCSYRLIFLFGVSTFLFNLTFCCEQVLAALLHCPAHPMSRNKTLDDHLDQVKLFISNWRPFPSKHQPPPLPQVTLSLFSLPSQYRQICWSIHK